MAVTAAGGVLRALRGAGRLWNGDPYRVADPAVTSQRLDGLTQQVYDTLDVPQATLDPKWPGGGQEADGSGCYYTGLKDLTKQVSDSPPSVPGVVAVSSEWGSRVLPIYGGVGAATGAEGIDAARMESHQVRDQRPLDRTERAAPGHRRRRPGRGFPYDRLGVVAYSECARYPWGTPMTEWGDPELPAQQAPAPLEADLLGAGVGCRSSPRVRPVIRTWLEPDHRDTGPHLGDGGEVVVGVRHGQAVVFGP